MLSYMKILLINRPIVSLIAPPLKRFLIFFCLAAEDLYNDGAKGGDGSDHLTLWDLCTRLTGSIGLIVKAHLLQLYILEMFVNPFIL